MFVGERGGAEGVAVEHREQGALIEVGEKLGEGLPAVFFNEAFDLVFQVNDSVAWVSAALSVTTMAFSTSA